MFIQADKTGKISLRPTSSLEDLQHLSGRRSIVAIIVQVFSPTAEQLLPSHTMTWMGLQSSAVQRLIGMRNSSSLLTKELNNIRDLRTWTTCISRVPLPALLLSELQAVLPTRLALLRRQLCSPFNSSPGGSRCTPSVIPRLHCPEHT